MLEGARFAGPLCVGTIPSAFSSWKVPLDVGTLQWCERAPLAWCCVHRWHHPVPRSRSAECWRWRSIDGEKHASQIPVRNGPIDLPDSCAPFTPRIPHRKKRVRCYKEEALGGLVQLHIVLCYGLDQSQACCDPSSSTWSERTPSVRSTVRLSQLVPITRSKLILSRNGA